MADQDPLLLLRQAIAVNKPFIPSASDDASAPEVALSQATHLRFPDSGTSLALSAPTRFISAEKPVDLRSIHFAWLNRELAIPEYNAAATTLNGELEAASVAGKVQNLGFIERLDLITWLEGASEESEYIKPLEGDGAAVAAGSLTATAQAGAAAAAASARAGKGTMDPRLASVYDGERRMGDRNTALRGTKPTDFSFVRKIAGPFIVKKPSAGAVPAASVPTSISSKTSSRRPDPIILLSPSASSLLRMSNARSFLENGQFLPPDAGASAASMLHVQRPIRSIEPNRPMRFILVEGPEQFKPEYWNRVVAVFTTGQSWQFKNYKWSNPNELFKHVLGIHINWRGDVPPEAVQGWGHRVLSLSIDRWRGEGHEGSRFRDKEAVEQIWGAIEVNMRSKGWAKDKAPSSI